MGSNNYFAHGDGWTVPENNGIAEDVKKSVQIDIIWGVSQDLQFPFQ